VYVSCIFYPTISNAPDFSDFAQAVLSSSLYFNLLSDLHLEFQPLYAAHTRLIVQSSTSCRTEYRKMSQEKSKKRRRTAICCPKPGRQIRVKQSWNSHLPIRVSLSTSMYVSKLTSHGQKSASVSRTKNS